MDMERVNVADIPAPVPPRRKKRPNSGKPMVGEGKENTLSDSISKSSKKPRIESKMKVRKALTSTSLTAFFS